MIHLVVANSQVGFLVETLSDPPMLQDVLDGAEDLIVDTPEDAKKLVREFGSKHLHKMAIEGENGPVEAYSYAVSAFANEHLFSYMQKEFEPTKIPSDLVVIKNSVVAPAREARPREAKLHENKLSTKVGHRFPSLPVSAPRLLPRSPHRCCCHHLPTHCFISSCTGRGREAGGQGGRSRAQEEGPGHEAGGQGGRSRAQGGA